jgi:hypothetical protein
MTAEPSPKSEAVHSDPKPSTTTATNGTAEPKVRSEPQQPIPSNRIHFDNQLKFLRAYAAASNQGAKPVSNEDVAAVVEMQASTVSLANNFFIKNGFLIRSGRELLPAKEVLEYKLAHDWDPNTAAHKLAPLVERSWFGQALKPKLDLRPMEEGEAIADLAQRANVGPEYRGQIKTMIDYMVTSGMVARDGAMLTLNRRRPNESTTEPTVEKSAPLAPKAADDGNVDLGQLPFGQVGSIRFAVSINVDMTQMSQWEPHRITAFFTGLAQVIASQKGGRQV